MVVERKKHYLTTKEYSVLTGPKNSFTRKKADPRQVRTNMVKGTISDTPSLKEIWDDFVKEVKAGFEEYK